ncbi:carboxylesterase/lipase family protein [Occultella glacieicola]|uniref:Carboxylic ester hydrolase n=1 Tax=Occultella glacieicola TaxID=2518684 RepID=A0ABY2E7U4_9MICO|nr:carboxylesterase family protein [Occultella glacieicola]TDE97637.1 carboxylesterase/lipase family protein [Occultella glacieicola]
MVVPLDAGVDPVVATRSGRVRGVRRPGSFAFRGIPYAAAPVGPLRFGRPAPHPGWSGVRDATRNGPTPSLGPTTDTYSIPEPVVPGEQILNLNVFTPTLDGGARLPVYVWIHGGGFVGGSPGGPWFDGAAFNADGVVTVAITYRLGFEGYGHVPGAQENRALRDCISALEWVQENIAAFGGDPGRVTLGGQSAGGGAALALLAAPAAQDLFGAAIVHSAPLPDIRIADAVGQSAVMARLCGVENTWDSWREVPREQIVAAERSLDRADLWSAVRDLHRILGTSAPLTAFGPVIDDDLVPVEPLAAFSAGTGAAKPVLIGATSHEFNGVTAHVDRFLAQGFAGAILVGLGVPAVLARAYPRAYPDFSPAELLGQAVTNRVFRIPTVRVALARTATSGATPPVPGAAARPGAGPMAPTWLWDFRWRSAATGRSPHCLDLPFAWHVLDAERVTRIAGTDPPLPLADHMHGEIVRFITEGTVGWEPFRPEAPVAHVFDEESVTGRDPFRFERLALQAVDDD